MYKYLILCTFLFIYTAGYTQIPYIDSKEVLKKGYEYYDNKEYKKSVEEYRKIQESDTNYVTAVYEQVLSLTADSAFEEAKALAKDGLKLWGADKRDFLLSLAAVYDYLGQNDSAAMIYDSLIALSPHDHQPLYEKGIIYFRKKDYDKAVSYFQRSLLINPDHFSSHYMLGLTYILQGRITEAFIALESSLLVTDNAQNAKKSISLISSLTNETDEIVKAYREKAEQYSHPLFDDIDQIVNSKIALSKDYKLKMSLGDDIFRQSQVIMEKLKYIPGDSNFVMQYYVPLYAQIFKDDEFENFTLLQYSGYGFENIDDMAKKREKNVTEVKQVVFPYFAKIQGTRVLDYNKRQKAASMYHYYPKEDLIIVGTSVKTEKDELIVGNVEMFRNNQLLLSRGAYDNKGEKDGKWTFYYASGKAKSILHYMHGKEVDSSIYYYKNGNLKIILISDKAGNAKEQYDFDVKGWLSSKKKKLTDDVIEHWSYYANGQLEYYEKYDDKNMIDGRYNVYYQNGKVKKEMGYKDGALSGAYKTWFENGKLSEEMTYENGKVNGKDIEYYENGKVKEQTIYKNGKAEGLDEKYDEDGRLTEKAIYTGGVMDEMNDYTPEGRIYETIKLSDNIPYYLKFTDDEGHVVFEKEDKKGIYVYKLYYANGNVAVDMKINDKGVRDGLITFYYETGAKSEETNYKDGKFDGSSVAYYKNGKKKEEETYTDNVRDGYCKYYFENGVLKSEGWYKEGKKQGPWRYYFINGSLKSEQYMLNDKVSGTYKDYDIKGVPDDKYYYEDGELIAHICYDTSGQRTDSVFYDPTAGTYKVSYWAIQPKVCNLEYSLKYGNMTGACTKRFVTGKQQEMGYYKDGLRDSIYTSYYPDGRVRSKGAFKKGYKTGKWEYFDEVGKVWREENFNENGDLDGALKSYSAGMLRIIYFYKKGNKDSAQVYYGEDGKIAFELLFKEQKFTGYTYEGKDGKLLPEIKLKNGTGAFSTYYSNGQKSAEMQIEQNFFKGVFRIYYSDGKLAEERTYDDNYNLAGMLKRYSPNGKPLFEVPYKDDEENGEERTYDGDGNLVISANYYYGLLNGPTKVTDAATGKTSTYNYHVGNLISVAQ